MSSSAATIEDLKRVLREWDDVPVAAVTRPLPPHVATFDSPVPMSPYVGPAASSTTATTNASVTTLAQLKPQLSAMTQRAELYADSRGKEHVSSLAANLSHQMEYNNALLLQMEALEEKNAAAGEQVQYLEAEVAQLRGALRVSTEQTQQLEKQVAAAVGQYETVVDENKALRDEAKNASAEAMRHSAQAEAQRRRTAQVEDGSTSHQQQIAHLQQVILTDREKHKAQVDALNRTVVDLEATARRLERQNRESGTNHLRADAELLASREEGIALQRSVDRALRQLEEEGGQIYELNRELKAEKARSLELARSGQEARLLLAQHEETVAMLQARLQDSSYFHGRADDEAASADAKWRRAEETLRRQGAELADCRGHIATLENMLESVTTHLEAADQV